MSSTIKSVLTILATLVIAWYLYHISLFVFAVLIHWLLPMAVTIGIIYVLYITVGKSAIEGGRKTLP